MLQLGWQGKAWRSQGKRNEVLILHGELRDLSNTRGTAAGCLAWAGANTGLQVGTGAVTDRKRITKLEQSGEGDPWSSTKPQYEGSLKNSHYLPIML